jgi:hypothetical protein
MVATRAAGAEPDEAWELVEGFGIASDLTGAEREFILDSNASEHDSIQFSWRGECFWVMLWALGYIDTMGRPDTMCDSERAVGILSDRTTAQFIADGWMRSPSEILDAADLIYRYHWAVRNAALNGEAVPAGLDPDVVMERHHALNWLVDSMGEQWDDISTDT